MKKRILASLVALIALFALTACGGKDKNKDYYGTWNVFYMKTGSGEDAMDMAFERGVSGDNLLQVVINEDGTMTTNLDEEGDEPAKFENTDTGIKIDEGDGSVMELTYTDGILKGNLTSEGATTEMYLYKEGSEPSAKEKELSAKASVTIKKDGEMKFKDGGEEPPAEETTEENTEETPAEETTEETPAE